jgi:CheY-like chemotaxis protein
MCDFGTDYSVNYDSVNHGKFYIMGAWITANMGANRHMTKRILVVDDDALTREVLEAFLGLVGYEVQLSPDAGSALKLLRHQTIDLIVTDIRMPDMDGFQFVTRLRAQAHTQHIPIIMVSGSNNPHDIAESQRVGANAFVPRPLDLRTFASLVHDTLQPPTAD